jgi:hypothetical protein
VAVDRGSDDWRESSSFVDAPPPIDRRQPVPFRTCCGVPGSSPDDGLHDGPER